MTVAERSQLLSALGAEGKRIRDMGLPGRSFQWIRPLQELRQEGLVAEYYQGECLRWHLTEAGLKAKQSAATSAEGPQ